MSAQVNDMNIAGFNVQMSPPDTTPDGFDEYGVRKNYEGDELESIDVIYDAMEPGIRKGVEITPEFLRTVAENHREEVPIQYDHSHSQRMNVGYMKDIKFSEQDGKLKKIFNIPNTGSEIRSDTIADFTHSTGPQIRDGSVGFDPQSLEFAEPENDDAKAQFQYAELVEFSLTPFPAGYDNGGITPEFSEAVDSFASSHSQEPDTNEENQLIVENNERSQLAESQLK
jgi:hypothetical protein